MGFGYLVLGYIFTYVMSLGTASYQSFFCLVGAAFLLLSLVELQKYQKWFRVAYPVVILLLIDSLIGIYSWINTTFLLNLVIFGELFKQYEMLAILILRLLLHFSLYFPIYRLAKQVDLPEIQKSVIRNLIFVTAYYVFDLLLETGCISFDKTELVPVMLIFAIIFVIMNLILFMTCYMRICPKGQENMQRKKSKFVFINRFYEKYDEEEQQTIDYIKQKIDDKKYKKKDKNIQHHKYKRK